MLDINSNTLNINNIFINSLFITTNSTHKAILWSGANLSRGFLESNTFSGPGSYINFQKSNIYWHIDSNNGIVDGAIVADLRYTAITPVGWTNLGQNNWVDIPGTFALSPVTERFIQYVPNTGELQYIGLEDIEIMITGLAAVEASSGNPIFGICVAINDAEQANSEIIA